MNLLKFFSKHQHDIDLNKYILPEDAVLPYDGEIWENIIMKGNFVKIVCVAYDSLSSVTCFNKCDSKGLFISIRDEKDNITKQPVYLDTRIFLVKYKLHKKLF